MSLRQTAQPLLGHGSGVRRAPGAVAGTPPDANRQAALHRISSASCHEPAGEPGRAANLYRAALDGPLTDAGRKDVEKKLSACLKQLRRRAAPSVA
jgi:hypothetical protein